MIRSVAANLFVLALAAVLASGCSVAKHPSYPAERIKESLLEICSKEYGIDNLEVKIEGKTVGVYLPLGQLFATDFQEVLESGRVKKVENLFQPSEEAIEKIEDLLFALSRVLLSTDKPIDFYSLQVTDVDNTGLQLVLKGFVNDIKRVRIWDIPRSEYRKRIIHELRLNQAVIWHRPARYFFRDLEALPLDEVREKYFGISLPTSALRRLFFDILTLGAGGFDSKILWKISDMRSIDLDRTGAVVYAKVRPEMEGHPELELVEMDLEYLFLVSITEEAPQLVRIIPFQYRNEQGKWTKIAFPKELQLENNLSEWKQEFNLEAMMLGPYLSEQLTRRVQALTSLDERVQNTFHELKIDFYYDEDEVPPSFSMNIQAELRDRDLADLGSLAAHEDMLYVLELASREFVDVLRNYRFGDYGHLSLNFSEEPIPRILSREDLEMFRRGQLDMGGLLFAKL